MLDLLGIIIGLGLLMFLAYKGMSIIWIAPITAGIVALFGGLDLLQAYTVDYMGGFVGFARAWFPVFLFGAIFGKVMDDTGAARAVAHWIIAKIGKKQAILAVVLGCGVLTYGGVSLFVVVFAMYPLALALFREANLSRALIPGAIALGSFTFTMTAIPGSPQIQNLIPMQYYGTTPTAAPIMGVAGAIVMLVVGMLWMLYSAKKRTEAGEVYTELTGVTEIDVAALPNPLVSAIPLLSVILLLNLFNLHILYSLGAGILLAIGFNFNVFIGPNKKSLIKTLNDGASGSVLAIINTSAAVGFGAVVRAVPGFIVLQDLVLGIGGNPLISQAVAVNILAGATGSASGGMGIALEALGAQYMELAQTTGIAPAAFHRVASIASGGLDTLPHNGAVLTLLAVTSMTHKTSYKDIFMVGSAIPILALIVAIILASIGLV
jgi:H+/gluconate symporter-like permease